MKTRLSIIFVCLIIFSSNLIMAQQEEPLIISPFVGNTLDRVERDFFEVLPTIEEFEEAKFYLNSDNSLKAVIKLNRNGVKTDTVLERYSSRKQLELLIVSNILKNISNDENKVVSIKLKKRKSEMKEQRIYTINDSTMFTINQSRLEEKVTNPRYSMVKGTRLPKIERVIIQGQGISNYILPSMGVGAGVGLLTGIAILSLKFEGTSSENELVNASRGAYAFGVMLLVPLIGAGIGLLISPIVGVIFSEGDKSIDPNTPSGLAELEPYISLQRNDHPKE